MLRFRIKGANAWKAQLRTLRMWVNLFATGVLLFVLVPFAFPIIAAIVEFCLNIVWGIKLPYSGVILAFRILLCLFSPFRSTTKQFATLGINGVGVALAWLLHNYSSGIASAWFSLIPTIAEFWVRTTKSKLKSAERALLCESSISEICVSGLSWAHWGNIQSAYPPVVLMHGLGMGKAMYDEVAKILSDQGLSVYAVDWLGMGLSHRPRCRTHTSLSQSEGYFVDALEKWRIAMGIEQFVLVGHSLGGYLSGVYATKFPERLVKLVLASPVGIPDGHIKAPIWIPLLAQLWRMGLTPHACLHLMGPFGPTITQGFVHRRYHNFPPERQQLTANYLYHINASPLSGNAVVPELFEVLALARDPLFPRISTLVECDVVMIYGEHDWMDAHSGLALVRRMRDERRLDRSRFYLLAECDHQVFVRKPNEFSDIIIAELLNLDDIPQDRISFRV